MTIIVGYAATEEGRAALTRALDEARLRGLDLVVVDSTRTTSTSADTDGLAEAAAALAGTGVAHELRPRSALGEPADDIVAAATETEAALIVIGLRRRTPVGKLILGTNAQRILLDAPCPVLTVKPAALTPAR